MAMRAWLFAFVLGGACTLAHAQTADPLAPAREGAIECFGPNVAVRTCEAMTSYRFSPDGQIANDGITYLQVDPPIIGYGASVITIRDGLICTPVNGEAFEAMRFTINGAAASPEATRELRSAIAESLAGIGELCWRYTQDGSEIRATAYADGVERPDMSDRMIWVRREDGYTLAPPAIEEDI